MKKIILASLLFLPSIVFGAQVLVEVDTRGASINALEGEILLPQAARAEEVRVGDSSILIWIVRPEVVDNKIEFAGLTPGGFSGKRAVFAITGDFDQALIDRIDFRNIRALTNDGEGLESEVLLSVRSIELGEDVVPPEEFAVEFSSAQEFFDGVPFLSFLAQDKGSGVSRYEAVESYFFKPEDSLWQEVESPYLIKDKLLFRKVYIKAIDAYGNERVEVHSLPNRAIAKVFLVILIAVLCAVTLRRSIERWFSGFSS